MNRLTLPLILLLVATALPVSASDMNSEGALAKAIASGRPTLLQFGARWCHSCSVLAPRVEAAAKDRRYADKINFIHVDVDSNETLRSTYRVSSIPVIILINGSGKEIGRRFGAVERPDLLKLLDRSLITP